MDSLNRQSDELITTDDLIRAGFCRTGVMGFANKYFAGLTAVTILQLHLVSQLDGSGSISEFLKLSGDGYGYGDGYGSGYGTVNATLK